MPSKERLCQRLEIACLVTKLTVCIKTQLNQMAIHSFNGAVAVLRFLHGTRTDLPRSHQGGFADWQPDEPDNNPISPHSLGIKS